MTGRDIVPGVFVRNPRTGKFDLMLNVERLAINDKHIVEYDKHDATHRQLLAMRGYELEPVRLNIGDTQRERRALIRHKSTFALGTTTFRRSSPQCLGPGFCTLVCCVW